jgi:hypothetical membrane protein
VTGRDATLVGVLASVPVLVATVVVVGAITPGYSQLADTVSRLGSPGQPYAWVARSGFVLYGVLVSTGAGAIGGQAPVHRAALTCLVRGYAAAAVVAGLASKDPPGPVHTTASQVHVLATILGGVMVVVAMALVAVTTSGRATQRLALSCGAVTIVGAVVFRWTWGSSCYGLVERVLLATGALWVASLAWAELRPGRGANRFQDRERRALR